MESNIGQSLKQLIEDKGLNKAEIARKLDITPQGLNSMFKRDSMETRTLIKIAEVINVPVKYFFGNEWDNGLNQSASSGGINVAHSKTRNIKNGRDSDLVLCLERVKGLEREVELLREMNDLLKKK